MSSLQAAIEQYFRDLAANRATGATVPETTHYAALQKLLDAIGAELKPPVRCITGLSNQGAGMPDAGLFVASQFQRDGRSGVPTNPERGAIEAKGVGADVRKTARSPQVEQYWQKYRQVLVTNFREFILVGCDEAGQKTELERLSLAKTEAQLWELVQQPKKLATDRGEQLAEYLKRVMLSPAAIATPADLAWVLASYARDARSRIEQHQDLPALQTIRDGFEAALGIHFEAARGDRFFRSTLVQTLFYGIFSAWVLWHREGGKGTMFFWEKSWRFLRVPVLQALFYRLGDPETLERLNLLEILDWTAAALNRVDRAEFFKTFDDSHAVQYFYEPFLQAFDPELRKELGVWYTPPEVVRYMVERVDLVLREELNCPDGLASPDVYILDPCCGTGAYLVAAIEKIAATLASKSQGSSLGALGGMAETGQNLKDIVLSRVFGFELLTAPFVIAHLQVGLLLQRHGQELELYGDDRDRVGIFLTNALTGWREGDPLPIPGFPALERERDAAETVKKSTPILVVLGNPPYNSFAGMAIDEERELSDAYRTTERAPKPQGQGLNDLYVRFFRMAERRIIEKTQRGVVCFISNYSWLDGLSFTGMRERYLKSFDRIWIDNLNGDKYATGKVTPDGKPDPSIFSTEWNKEGIQVGTAIALLLKQENSQQKQAKLAYRDFWGKSKLQDLIASVKPSRLRAYQKLKPNLDLGLPFTPKQFGNQYLGFPSITELLPVFLPGIKTDRDDALIDISRSNLENKIQQYFDPLLNDQEISDQYPVLMKSSENFNATETRNYLVARGCLRENFVPYDYRPLDRRWIYWEPETNLINRKRPEYFALTRLDNLWIATAQKHRRQFDPPLISKILASLHVNERGASLFPINTPLESLGRLFEGSSETILHGSQLSINYSPKSAQYLQSLGLNVVSEDLFLHCISITYSKNYRDENADVLKQDWPRIPLPNDRELLQSSAELGKRIAALLDPETPVETITRGMVVAPYSQIAVPATTHGQNFQGRDFALTANWGNGGNGKPVMPGKGKAVQRDYTDRERQQMGAAAIQLLGATTYDVYLNETAYWQNIPERVWKYTIGGYQVIKKWLSYRAEKVINRPMKPAEVQEVVNIARRISAIVLMETDLDANYQAVKANLYDWSSLR